MKSKMWIGAIAGVMLLGGTAVVGASGNTNTQNLASTNQTTQSYITIDQAKTAALKAANGRVDDVDLERDHGKVYYEVDIEQTNGEVEVHVDALTGKVLSVLDKDKDDDDHDHSSSNGTVSTHVKITSEQASAIAAKQVSGGRVVKIELDEDDNRYIYEVDLRTTKGEAEVEVDANTGKVLSIDQDFDDED